MNNIKTLGLVMAFFSGALGVLLLIASFSEKVKYPLPPLFFIAGAGFTVSAFIILLLVTILSNQNRYNDKANG